MSKLTPPIDEIFCRALELDGQERIVYLDRIAATNLNVHARVLKLLEAHQKAGEFLEERHIQGLIDALTQNPIGGVIGNYKLLDVLGEGGMGIVFVAEQLQPIKRVVALKIVKPGLSSSQIVARFELERQALGMMDHLNIAKVYDAGQTPLGHPYLAMEFIDGQPITKYCIDHDVDIRQRVMLFKDVCHAVQHAHQKGIIHRDLKPSNILVSQSDGKPIPKVIDFGIARLADPANQQATCFTHDGQLLGTLEYMSPEQLEFGRNDIDVRSDVYSLGVLLYELLTGETPFNNQRFRDGGFEDRISMLKNEEPVRPSVKIRNSKSIPRLRVNTPAAAERLAALVREELDWVALKALDKNREYRYQSVTSLAADITRYLSGDLVEASPPTINYRLRKWIRKNKAILLITSAIVLSMGLGLVGTTWQARTAAFERDAAQIATQRSIASERLSSNLLKQVQASEKEAKDQRNEALEATKRAEAEALAATSISEFLREDFIGMADVGRQFESSIAINPDIGLSALLAHAEIRAKQRFADQPVLYAEILSSLGQAYGSVGNDAKQIDLISESHKIFESQLGSEHSNTIDALMNLSAAYNGAGDHARAFELGKTAVNIAENNFGPEDIIVLRSKIRLANCLLHRHEYVAATLLLEPVVEQLIATVGKQNIETIWAMHLLGYSMLVKTKNDKRERGIALQQEALELHKSLMGNDHPNTVKLTSSLAVAYEQVGKLEESLDLCEKSLELANSTYGETHPTTIGLMFNTANRRYQMHHWPEASELMQKAVELSRIHMANHPLRIQILGTLSSHMQFLGNFEDAVPLAEEAVELQHRLSPDNQNPELLFHLGVLYNQVDLADEESRTLDRALARTENNGTYHPNTVRQKRHQLAKANTRAGYTLKSSKIFEDLINNLDATAENAIFLSQLTRDQVANYAEAGLEDLALTIAKEKLAGNDMPTSIRSIHKAAIACEYAYALQRQGETTAALMLLAGLSDTDPKIDTTNEFYLRMLADAYRLDGQSIEAIKTYKQIQSPTPPPSDANVAFELAQLCLQNGEPDLASATVRRIVDSPRLNLSEIQKGPPSEPTYVRQGTHIVAIQQPDSYGPPRARLLAVSFLAEIEAMQSNWKEVAKQLEALLIYQEKLLGLGHPDCKSTVARLSVAQEVNGMQKVPHNSWTSEMVYSRMLANLKAGRVNECELDVVDLQKTYDENPDRSQLCWLAAASTMCPTTHPKVLGELRQKISSSKVLLHRIVAAAILVRLEKNTEAIDELTAARRDWIALETKPKECPLVLFDIWLAIAHIEAGDKTLATKNWRAANAWFTRDRSDQPWHILALCQLLSKEFTNASLRD